MKTWVIEFKAKWREYWGRHASTPYLGFKKKQQAIEVCQQLNREDQKYGLQYRVRKREITWRE